MKTGSLLKFSFKIFQIAALIYLLKPVNSFSQDNLNSGISPNMPSKYESLQGGKKDVDNSAYNKLERKHKQTEERGDTELAKKIESQMMALTPDENKFVTIPDDAEARKLLSEIKFDPQQNDWQSANSVITPGSTKFTTLHKQIDVKSGEDNNLYAVVNGTASAGLHGYFFIYKSTDYGLTWTSVYSVGSGTYISNVSLLVESRNNSIADSTRLTVFYTSGFASDYTDAKICYYSLRRNATGIYSGEIASPSPGKCFTHISTVSDGAYWQNLTYFGVICTESDNVTGNTSALKFFRTVNWGASWTGAVINTTFNDFFPSADYKEGSSDSVYIAVERRFSPTNSEIRVIATPWIPSAAFNTYYLTNTSSRYEKPCLTVKQDTEADSIMITCTKDGQPMYHFTPNGGASWSINFLISNTNGSNKNYTYCSSSKTGATPFSVCWSSNDGDSINVRRGVFGNLGNTVYKVNTNTALNSITPVCLSLPFTNSNVSLVAYASNPNGVYSTQEGSKSVNIKLMPQGFYDPATNSLNMSDTLRLYVRNSGSPYTIIDSGKSVIDSILLNANYQFTTLGDGLYYFSLKHRNSIETWSYIPASLITTSNNDYNFTVAATTAYGNNLVQVDASPVKFAAYSGDENQDGNVDATDIVAVYNDGLSFASGYLKTDMTGDSFVDVSDLVITYNNSKNFVSIARP